MRAVMRVGFLGVTLGACGGGDGGGGGPDPEATQLAFTVQPGPGTAGQVLAPPIQVSVQDASGNLVPTASQTVALALAPVSNGAVLGGTASAAAASGVAVFSDLTVSRAGNGYTLTASAPGLTAATSAPFDVQPVAGVAATMEAIAGAGTSAIVGEVVSPSPAVRVLDGFGDPVADVPVTFAIAAGTGDVEGADQTTGADGSAAVGDWRLGTIAGANALSAASPGLEGVTFTASGTPAAAEALGLNAGDDQEASVGSPVTVRPSVAATDAFGNGVSGVTVTFEVTSGGGSVGDPVQVTGGDGVATVGEWSLGGAPGPNSLTASADGLTGSPVTFSANAIPLAVTAAIQVRNNFFRSLQNGTGGNPGALNNYARDTVAVGGTVTWEWVGQNHNVSDAFGSATSGDHDAPHSYSLTFNAPGTYTYRCTNHSDLVVDLISGMAGIIVVR